MITQEQVKQKLNDLLKGVTPGDLPMIQQKMSEHLRFCVDNYDQLEPEAQKMTDNALKGISDYIGEVIKNCPESKEKRQLRRIHAIGTGKHHKITSIIANLESTPEHKDENSKDFREKFITGLQLILDLVFDIQKNTIKGPASFGQLSLLCMNIDELLAAFHLAQHHYINQAFAHARTVFEHLDKIELFRIMPECADIWCSNDEKEIRKKLSPAEVRKKLGKNKFDPLYDTFSKLGPHGTFKAVQTRTATKAELSEKGNPEIIMWYGGCPLEYNLVWINAFLLYALFLVVLQIMKSFGSLLNQDECRDIVQKIFNELRDYTENHFLQWAKKNGYSVTEFEEYLKSRKWGRAEDVPWEDTL